ncbi:MAG: exodeoxyribonuclease VII small subunit [Oscillospiraceae bacterium]|nr:exodeoxyribonuclease VII small subunit [Oscillospiraceae bacterium]
MQERSFEESIKRLEEIIGHLEKGDIALQESLSLFEEGTALLAACNRMLESAEQKVLQLRKGADRQPEAFPFEDSASGNE